MRLRTPLIAFVLIAALIPALPAAAGITPTLYVDNAVTCDNATVDSLVTPYCDIEAAVDDANALGGDLIDVAPGIYTDHDSDGYVVEITKNVAIQGSGWPSTIIDGQDTDIGVRVAGTDVYISGVTVKNADGGGVLVVGGSGLSLSNSLVTLSTATLGGGIQSYANSTTTLNGVIVSYNTATTGGGGMSITTTSGTTTVNIIDSEFRSNEAPTGGALYGSGSATTTIDIDGTWFHDNYAANNGGAIGITSAPFTVTIDTSNLSMNGAELGGGSGNTTNGGAIYASLGTMTITDSLLSQNLADNGGAIYATPTSISIRNTTISGNTATGQGGGLSGFTGTMENSTVSFNHAGTIGGLGGSITTPPTVRNTIISDNSYETSIPDCYYVASDGYNLIEDTTGCTISGTTTGNITGTDPGLVALADNGGPTETHAFAVGAAPHNAGNPASPGSGGSACLGTDQRGETRAFGACDIGAFELDTYATRLSGVDRFSTAVAISQQFWPGTSDTVIIANGLGFPDALTGANLYGFNAPLLLVMPNSIPTATSDELTRLSPSTIYVLGGTAVVDTSVATALGAWGTVERLSGVDRYSTAAAITTEAFPGTVTNLLIANGLNFPDALAGGAAVAKAGGALLITDPNTLPAVISAEITRLSPTKIYVLGGTAAVSASVFTALEGLAGDVVRVSGPDRFYTAVAISAEFFSSASKVLVATGFNYPDALAGTLAAGGTSPVLLIATSSVPTVVADEITRLGATTVFVLGGTAAIDPTAFSALEALVGL